MINPMLELQLNEAFNYDKKLLVFSNKYVLQIINYINQTDITDVYLYTDNAIAALSYKRYINKNKADKITYVNKSQLEEINVNFDYIVANPPYSDGKNKMLWKQIMDRAKMLSNKVDYIAPSAAIGGSLNWKKHKDYLYEIEYLPENTFPVGVNIGLARWSNEVSKTIKYTYEDNKGKFITEILDKSKFPFRLPRVKMTMNEYHKTFDQKGVPWVGRIEGESGVWRPKGGLFEYTDSLPLTKNMGKSQAGFIPCKREKGEKLAKLLTTLLHEGKIEGQWGFLMSKYWVGDIDSIRADLVI